MYKKLQYAMLAVGAGVIALTVVADNDRITEKEAIVLDKPTFSGQEIYRLPYGTEVNVLQERGVRVQIQAEGKETGWTFKRAVGELKNFDPETGEDVSTKTTQSEYATAADGLSEVEKRYIRDRSQLRAEYNLLDNVIEREAAFEASPQGTARFMDEGGLLKGGLQ